MHLIREDLIAVLCPIWVDRPRSCNGNNVRLFSDGTESQLVVMFVFLVLFSIN